MCEQALHALLYHPPPPCPLEARSLSEPGARLAASNPHLVSAFLQFWGPGAKLHGLLRWMLGIPTQILMPAQQVLLPAGPPP